MVVGRNLFGAQMSVTVAGLDFQFSEVSKVLMIAVLAAYLSGRRERIGRLSTILVRRGADGDSDAARLPPAGPRDGARLRRHPARDAVMSGASLGWMGLMATGVIGAAPVVVGLLHDYQRSRLLLLPRSLHRRPGSVLPAGAGPERRRLGRVVRPRLDGRRRGPARVHPRSSRPTSSSRSWPRTWASSEAQSSLRSSAC